MKPTPTPTSSTSSNPPVGAELPRSAIDEAARLLWTTWQAGDVIAALPPACRPRTREDAYRIQAAVLEVSGRTPFGWKIAATSQAGQRHIGVEGPLAGRLLDGQIHAAGQTVPFHGIRMAVAEPEFAFRMGQTLLPQSGARSVEAVMQAVEALHLAIEIPDSRFADFVSAGSPQLIADNACAHRFVLGPQAPASWREVDLARHRVHAEVSAPAGLRYERKGEGANVLGDPRWALTWLANELSRIGLPLRAGEVITTGTCMPPLEILPDDTIRVDFGGFGSVSARMGLPGALPSVGQ